MPVKLLYAPAVKTISILNEQVTCVESEVVTSNYAELSTVTKLSRFYRPDSLRIRKIHVLLGVIENGTTPVELAVTYKNYEDDPANPYDLMIEPSLLNQFPESLREQFRSDLIDFLIRSEGA